MSSCLMTCVCFSATNHIPHGLRPPLYACQRKTRPGEKGADCLNRPVVRCRSDRCRRHSSAVAARRGVSGKGWSPGEINRPRFQSFLNSLQVRRSASSSRRCIMSSISTVSTFSGAAAGRSGARRLRLCPGHPGPYGDGNAFVVGSIPKTFTGDRGRAARPPGSHNRSDIDHMTG